MNNQYITQLEEDHN